MGCNKDQDITIACTKCLCTRKIWRDPCLKKNKGFVVIVDLSDCCLVHTFVVKKKQWISVMNWSVVVYGLIVIGIQGRSLVRRNLNKKKKEKNDWSCSNSRNCLYKRNRKMQCVLFTIMCNCSTKKILFDFLR